MEQKKRWRVAQPDILFVLQEVLKQEPLHRPGTADGNVNPISPAMSVGRLVIEGAIAEIERLRRLAGAVSPGESFLDLRKASRTPSGYVPSGEQKS